LFTPTFEATVSDVYISLNIASMELALAELEYLEPGEHFSYAQIAISKV
jgi:hypothetical protein